MKFGSLFSGIGGFDLAFERAGMECVWQCEIDKAAQSVLKKHFGKEIFEDVRNLTGAEPVDLICGGFPCQDLSVAGKRKGLAGERSGLWFEFARVIDEFEPKWVVIENVPGLLSSNKGRDFAVILRWLVERGYGVCWRVLDAQNFGLAQRRKRVFIVASFGNGRCAEVLFEREGMSGNTEKGGEAGETPATTFTIRSGKEGGGKGYLGLDDSAMTLGGQPQYLSYENHPNDSRITETGDISQQLTGRMGTGGGNVPLVQMMSSGQANAEITEDISPSLTLLHEQPIVNGVRRLTPTECERLQGFPETKKGIIIDVCLDHQKNSAGVEISSLRLQKPVGNVEKNVSQEIALSVAQNSNINYPQINKPVLPRVVINCEENKIEIFNQEKLISSASFVENKNLFLPHIPYEDFVLLVAGISTILENITGHGEGELHPKERELILHKNGQIVVGLSGNEIMQLVKGAETPILTNKKPLRSIISNHLSIKSFDFGMRILCYSALIAISGFIPKETLTGPLFQVEINTSFGYTYGQADGQRYKQLGNAVAVPVAKWIGRRIIDANN